MNPTINTSFANRFRRRESTDLVSYHTLTHTHLKGKQKELAKKKSDIFPYDTTEHWMWKWSSGSEDALFINCVTTLQPEQGVGVRINWVLEALLILQRNAGLVSVINLTVLIRIVSILVCNRSLTDYSRNTCMPFENQTSQYVMNGRHHHSLLTWLSAANQRDALVNCCSVRVNIIQPVCWLSKWSLWCFYLVMSIL